MKKAKWVNGNKMLFESEHKTFNKKVDCISTGNVIGTVQLSGHVRAYNELECNGRVNEPGHLQEYDLSWLVKELPYNVKDTIRYNCKDKGCWAYHFFYWNGKHERMNIGYAITHYNYSKWFQWVANPYNYKKESALNECVKYITKEGE